MARGRTESFLVSKETLDSARRVADTLVVEEPLTIQLDGHVVGTTMRTPGHDFELAVGLCHSDGLLAGAAVRAVKYCATGSALETAFNTVTVDTSGQAREPEPRLQTTTSSCGLCGTQAIDDVASRLVPLPSGHTAVIALSTVLTVAAHAASHQDVFRATGASHAAVAFAPSGAVQIVREDVGRHNAVDKVIGRLVLDNAVPAHDLGLFVSGRASFEMVYKAWAGGFGTLVSVSAPTALAVHTARRAHMTLYGFARDGSVVRYSPE